MFFPEGQVRVHLYGQPVDMRKSFDGLYALTRQGLGQDPLSGRERRCGLEVYLTDPDVPIDTNHLERALRAIPMGRKNWMFCWTELGARHVGIMQSLIVTCRLHQIDPYDYLVDVLQRVGQHPAQRVPVSYTHLTLPTNREV